MANCEFSSAFSSAFAICVAPPTPTPEAPSRTWDTGRFLESVPAPKPEVLVHLRGRLLIGVVGSGEIAVETKVYGSLEVRPALSGVLRVDHAVAGALEARPRLVAAVSVDVAAHGAVEMAVTGSGVAHVGRAVQGEVYALSYGQGVVRADCVMKSRRIEARTQMSGSCAVERVMHGGVMMRARITGDAWIANGEIAKALLGLPSEVTI